MKITDELIRSALESDNHCRKQQRWPLINLLELKPFAASGTPRVKPELSLFTIDESVLGYAVEFDPENALFWNPLVSKLLALGAGHLWICGGKIACHLHTMDPNNDHDFFFVGLNVQEAESLLKKCIASILAHDPRFIVYTSDLCTTLKLGKFMLQFIKRLYPRIDLVLGGFDIPYAAIGTDGVRVVGTPMAVFNLQNDLIIVDTTRRSPSYETRLYKYRKRFNIALILPGLSKEQFERSAMQTIYGARLRFPRCSISHDHLYVRNGHTMNSADKTDYAIDTYERNSIANSNKRHVLLKQYERIVTINGKTDGLVLELHDVEEILRVFPNSDHLKLLGPKLFALWRDRFSHAGHLDFHRNVIVELNELSARAEIEVFARRKRPTWITENPGRQWTSSTQPIFEIPSKWYGEYWRPFRIGLDDRIWLVLQLGRRDRSCVLEWLPKDVFRLVISAVFDLKTQDFIGMLTNGTVS